MPNLKDLKGRITSVRATSKITSAMKMVAASRLKRAQDIAEMSRPYANRIRRIIAALAARLTQDSERPGLLEQRDNPRSVLLIALSSDRGLCGAFNSNIAREVRRQVAELEAKKIEVKVFCIGRKARDQLRRTIKKNLLNEDDEYFFGKDISFARARSLTENFRKLFEARTFDGVHIIYNRFKSVLAQVITVHQLLPVDLAQSTDDSNQEYGHEEELAANSSIEFEPDQETILADLLPRSLAVQLLEAMLESSASEHAARMTSMDNATRNARDVSRRLTVVFNRTRQAYITKEMIEIVSGAEALR